ncbi:MAG TPA: YciI family protein, partial [Spirillospora sp.]
IQPVDWEPPPEELEEIMAGLRDIRADLEAQEAWIFGKALRGPEASTTVWCRGEETVASDGPWAEADEYVGGLVIVEAEDRDAALQVAARYARVTGLRVEVRPFQEGA